MGKEISRTIFFFFFPPSLSPLTPPRFTSTRSISLFHFALAFSFFHLIRANRPRAQATNHGFFASYFVRHRVLPVHLESIRAFLHRASVTLRLHLWFSFHNTRISHSTAITADQLRTVIFDGGRLVDATDSIVRNRLRTFVSPTYAVWLDSILEEWIFLFTSTIFLQFREFSANCVMGS